MEINSNEALAVIDIPIDLCTIDRHINIQTDRQTIREDLDTEMNSNEAPAIAQQTYRLQIH